MRGVPGVERVDNQLRVRLMESDERADADTEAAVLDAFITSDDVHVGDVDVAAAAAAPGVAVVHDHLTVRPARGSRTR